MVTAELQETSQEGLEGLTTAPVAAHREALVCLASVLRRGRLAAAGVEEATLAVLVVLEAYPALEAAVAALGL